MYAVIAENDESQWNDECGSLYHFPSRYRNMLTPGTTVLYYKGGLKKTQYRESRLSDAPHYFGVAKIGKVYPDKNSTKRDFFAIIEGFLPFEYPVEFKQKGEYLEQIPKNKVTNYWRDGVRKIDKPTYKRILSHSSISKMTSSKKSDSARKTKEAIEEVDLQTYLEGMKKEYIATRYERHPRLRKQALAIHGFDCAGCGFNFEETYGELGEGFIHIHHRLPLHTLSSEVIIDPEMDLVPLCPNCHAMVHRNKAALLDVKQLRELIKKDLG